MSRAIAGPGPAPTPQGAPPQATSALGRVVPAVWGRGAVKLAPLCPRSGRDGAEPAAGDDNLWQVPAGRHGSGQVCAPIGFVNLLTILPEL